MRPRVVIYTGSPRLRKTVYGRVPEWPMGTDCKSAAFQLRWFESTRAHQRKTPRNESSWVFSFCYNPLSNPLFNLKETMVEK